ncbi:hypothetical protein [uncultured Bacteroides sp.]|uniref:hypothetical protein n=1 Tax=uncultured Bacteroides sp. TaxID=162156 RepID=UPI00262F7A0E|nr:hypothetical protein [uncultured Bacteroides sp.]
MKILFVGLGRAGKHFSTERVIRQKLHESSLTNDVEVTTTDMADWESIGSHHWDSKLKNLILHEMDMIIVMEKWQKETLTRFMSYEAWHKIHLFADLCHKNKPIQQPSCDVDIAYRSDHEQMHDGCGHIIDRLKKVLADTGAMQKAASF